MFFFTKNSLIQQFEYYNNIPEKAFIVTSCSDSEHVYTLDPTSSEQKDAKVFVKEPFNIVVNDLDAKKLSGCSLQLNSL